MFGHAIAIAVVVATLAASPATSAEIGPLPVADAECRPLAPEATPSTLATPSNAAPSATPPLAGVDEIEERDLPPGDDASPDVVAALFTLERRYAACLNAFDHAAVLTWFDASFRDEAAAIFADTEDLRDATTVPGAENLIDTVALRCVRTYPGGYAVALLDWETAGYIETNARVYRDTGRGWVVAGEATAYGQQGMGCEAR